jgi:phosphohistidine phosphatase
MGLLVVMRHAKSAYPDGVPDHERPLAARGRREAPLMAPLVDRELAQEPWVLAWVSDAVRARQTWDLVSGAWGRNVRTAPAPDLYEADVAAIGDRVRRSGPADAVILVGHNPGFEDALRTWVGPGAPEKFPTSAFAVLECDQPWETFDRGAIRLRAFHIAR